MWQDRCRSHVCVLKGGFTVFQACLKAAVTLINWFSCCNHSPCSDWLLRVEISTNLPLQLNKDTLSREKQGSFRLKRLSNPDYWSLTGATDTLWNEHCGVCPHHSHWKDIRKGSGNRSRNRRNDYSNQNRFQCSCGHLTLALRETVSLAFKYGAGA